MQIQAYMTNNAMIIVWPPQAHRFMVYIQLNQRKLLRLNRSQLGKCFLNVVCSRSNLAAILVRQRKLTLQFAIDCGASLSFLLDIWDILKSLGQKLEKSHRQKDAISVSTTILATPFFDLKLFIHFFCIFRIFSEKFHILPPPFFRTSGSYGY